MLQIVRDRSICLCFLSAWSKDMDHHCLAKKIFFDSTKIYLGYVFCECLVYSLAKVNSHVCFSFKWKQIWKLSSFDL